MQKNISTCLEGPILGSKDWWQEFGRDHATVGDDFGATDLDSPPIRHDLVNRVRKEIAAGTYDTPEKWAMALDQLSRSIED